MFKLNYFIVLLLASHVLIANCGILDFVSFDEDDDAPQKRDRESDCLCLKANAEGNNCVCCLRLNVSEIFDVGPACAKIKFNSQEEGVTLNLTLGNSYSKAAVIKPSKPEESVCLSMLGGLAKMCAKFNGLVPSQSNGYVGCLTMQPKLFGEVPINFEFPCFDLNAQEIRMIEAPEKPAQSGEEEEEDEKDDESPTSSSTDETIGGFKVEDILNVVSQTADQGIKIISELFGIGEEEKEPTSQKVESKESPETPKNATKTK